MRNSIGDNFTSTNKTLNEENQSKAYRNPFDDKKKKYRRKQKNLTQEQIEVFRQAF